MGRPGDNHQYVAKRAMDEMEEELTGEEMRRLAVLVAQGDPEAEIAALPLTASEIGVLAAGPPAKRRTRLSQMPPSQRCIALLAAGLHAQRSRAVSSFLAQRPIPVEIRDGRKAVEYAAAWGAELRDILARVEEECWPFDNELRYLDPEP